MMEPIQKQAVETVEQDAAIAPEVAVEGGIEVVGADALHAELEGMADDYDVGGFKCVKCGLAHSHGTTKHRSSDSFDMSDDEAASMDFNPNCHCGVQELGRRGSDFGVSEADAASIAKNAPIPDGASREMNAQFGGL